MLNRRDTRFAEVFQTRKLTDYPVVIVGTGAVGKPLAEALASMGVERIVLWDHDRVDTVNLGVQGWAAKSVGKLKVDVLARELHTRNPDCTVMPQARRCDGKELPENAVVFLCVDNLDARKAIGAAFWEGDHRPAFMCDGRMTLDTLRVFAIHNDATYEKWVGTLRPQREAYAGRCTQQTTLHAAMLTAMRMIQMWTNWLREMPLPWNMNENLLTCDLESCYA